MEIRKENRDEKEKKKKGRREEGVRRKRLMRKEAMEENEIIKWMGGGKWSENISK